MPGIARRRIAALAATGCAALLSVVRAEAGERLYVPMSWCATIGSPAEAAPNVGADMTTDEVLWRRHERPTDRVFGTRPLPNISFRSAITRVFSTDDLSYPSIAVPPPPAEVPAGVLGPGDVYYETIELSGVEEERPEHLREVLRECKRAWEEKDIDRTLLERPTQPIGVTAVNANLIRNSAGETKTLGWGGCEQISLCGCDPDLPEPYIVVTDNTYLYPGTGNNIFPVPEDRPAAGSPITDPSDLVTAHELGHALGIIHREDDPLALMSQEGSTDDAGRFIFTNLNAGSDPSSCTAEIAILRESAANANGLERDPPGVFLPGRMVATRRIDEIKETEAGGSDVIAPHLDLSAVIFALDTSADVLTFKHDLLGVIPTLAAGERREYWTLIDADNDAGTGAPPTMVTAIGAPSTTFPGVEIAVKVDVSPLASNLDSSVTVWQWASGAFVKSSAATHASSLAQLVMYALPVPGVPLDPALADGVPFYHTVRAEIDTSALLPGLSFVLDQPVRLQALTAPGTTGGPLPPTDKLEGTDAGKVFVLERPVFPHCFPVGAGAPGETVITDVEGLVPDAPFHALIGPDHVLDGTADAVGAATIDLPIPLGTPPGRHLVTIGTDQTALTADCAVDVFLRLEFFDPFDLAQAVADLSIIDFDTLLPGDGVLTGDEFLGDGFKIAPGPGQGINVIQALKPGGFGSNFVTEANLGSAPNALSSSMFTDGIDHAIADDFEIEFTPPVIAAGLFIGNIGGEPDGDGSTIVEFLDADGVVLSSRELTIESQGIVFGDVGVPFDNRIFYGVASDPPIWRIRITNPGSDGDGILIDEFYVPEPAGLPMLAAGILLLLALDRRRRASASRQTSPLRRASHASGSGSARS